MIILIAGCGHTGKTLLAQKLLEKLSYPYLSIDHLKMGLIRTQQTSLSPGSSNAELTAYLWPILREMIKTAIENDQNLIVEVATFPLILPLTSPLNIVARFIMCAYYSVKATLMRITPIFLSMSV